jgi:hypothetical protein
VEKLVRKGRRKEGEEENIGISTISWHDKSCHGLHRLSFPGFFPPKRVVECRIRHRTQTQPSAQRKSTLSGKSPCTARYLHTTGLQSQPIINDNFCEKIGPFSGATSSVSLSFSLFSSLLYLPFWDGIIGTVHDQFLKIPIRLDLQTDY